MSFQCLKDRWQLHQMQISSHRQPNHLSLGLGWCSLQLGSSKNFKDINNNDKLIPIMRVCVNFQVVMHVPFFHSFKLQLSQLQIADFMDVKKQSQLSL